MSHKNREAAVCNRCDGCGQIANDDDGTPWKYWAELPYQSAASIVFGLVKPLTCPDCIGTGKANNGGFLHECRE